MKPSSVIDDYNWEDDSPREGPLSEHLRGHIDKLQAMMRESEDALRGTAMQTRDVRNWIRDSCQGYPRELHHRAALACRGVELARAQLATASAEILRFSPSWKSTTAKTLHPQRPEKCCKSTT